MRIILEEVAGYKKTDNKFMLDTLAKLPEGKEGEVGPYQVERRLRASFVLLCENTYQK